MIFCLGLAWFNDVPCMAMEALEHFEQLCYKGVEAHNATFICPVSL
jgi:hypothetical protein